jgi:hypothetical protein
VQIAAWMALWAGAVQQNPVVVQFAQNLVPVQVQVANGGFWDKWGPSILQTSVSLASIIAAVIISVVSFRNNRRLANEQWERNQNAAHDQWIRDQKKSEWSQLLGSLAAVQEIIRLAPEVSGKDIEQIRKGLDNVLRAISVSAARCVFVEGFRCNQDKWKRINSFTQKAGDLKNSISVHMEVIEKRDTMYLPLEEASNMASKTVDSTFILKNLYEEILLWAQEEAAKDLQS